MILEIDQLIADLKQFTQRQRNDTEESEDHQFEWDAAEIAYRMLKLEDDFYGKHRWCAGEAILYNDGWDRDTKSIFGPIKSKSRKEMIIKKYDQLFFSHYIERKCYLLNLDAIVQCVRRMLDGHGWWSIDEGYNWEGKEEATAGIYFAEGGEQINTGATACSPELALCLAYLEVQKWRIERNGS